MARAITQIEHDLTALEDEVVAIAQELSETYDEYLVVLGEAVQQQLILTSYYLCTQGYPDRFLKLSLNQRQQLQQSLQKIAKQVRADLQHPPQMQSLTEPFLATSDAVDSAELDGDEVTARNLAAIVRRVMLEKRRRRLEQDDEDQDDRIELAFHQDEDEDEDEFEGDEDLDGEIEAIFIPEELAMEFMASGSFDIQELTVEEDSEDEESSEDSAANESADPGEALAAEMPADEEAPAMLPTEALEKKDATAGAESVATLQQPSRLTPKALAMRCDRLEQQISALVKQATDDANGLLQTSNLLPKKLPDAVLEAALKANLSADVPGSPPNLLHLIVQAEDEEGQLEDTKIMRIMALRLRVSEIEFNNPTLMAWRSRLRELAAQLRKFERDHRKLRREQAIAEAEAAWRSSWYESDD